MEDVVTPPEDSLESIYDCARRMARTYSYGGGCGVDISKLAPNGAHMQSVWQKYIDASISSTVNLPETATVEDVESIYRYAWDKGLKGITVFRDKCRRTGILTTDVPKEAQAWKDKSIAGLPSCAANAVRHITTA